MEEHVQWSETRPFFGLSTTNTNLRDPSGAEYVARSFYIPISKPSCRRNHRYIPMTSRKCAVCQPPPPPPPPPWANARPDRRGLPCHRFARMTRWKITITVTTTRLNGWETKTLSFGQRRRRPCCYRRPVAAAAAYDERRE